MIVRFEKNLFSTFISELLKKERNYRDVILRQIIRHQRKLKIPNELNGPEIKIVKTRIQHLKTYLRSGEFEC